MTDEQRPQIFLSTTQAAERIGVQRSSLGRYRMPDPDALIGDVRGWLPQTIDDWNRARPGRGRPGQRRPRSVD